MTSSHGMADVPIDHIKMFAVPGAITKSANDAPALPSTSKRDFILHSPKGRLFLLLSAVLLMDRSCYHQQSDSFRLIPILLLHPLHLSSIRISSGQGCQVLAHLGKNRHPYNQHSPRADEQAKSVDVYPPMFMHFINSWSRMSATSTIGSQRKINECLMRGPN